MRRYHVLQLKCPYLLTNCNLNYLVFKLMLGKCEVLFQENWSHWSRDTDGKVLCSPSKVPFIDLQERNTWYLHVRGKRGGYEFSGKSLPRKPRGNGTVFSKSNIVCSLCLESSRYKVSAKSLKWWPRYVRKCTVSLQVSFITDQTEPNLRRI